MLDRLSLIARIALTRAKLSLAHQTRLCFAVWGTAVARNIQCDPAQRQSDSLHVTMSTSPMSKHWIVLGVALALSSTACGRHDTTSDAARPSSGASSSGSGA